MFQNKSTIQISPNLLANFDPFEILEPQKSGLRVEKLVDIDGSSPSLDVDPSLLDQKPSYDLVDLYQNFYVTPQHVKLKKTDMDATNNDPTSSYNRDDNDGDGPRVEKLIDIDAYNNPTTNFDGIDFKVFCDKIESGEKIDWTKDNVVKTTPRREFSEVTSKPEEEDDDLDPEELIKEVLQQKSIEKRYLDDINNGRDIHVDHIEHNVDSPKPKVLKSPSIDLLALKNAKTNTSNNKFESKDIPNCSKQVNSEIDPRLKLNNDYINSSNANKNINNQKIDGQIDNSVNFKVIPIKKDEKVFKKRQIMKPESQTCNFTKGPDLNEKEIVLPQIMARIYRRKEYLEKQNCMKKILVLDDRRHETKEQDHKVSNLDGVKKNMQSQEVRSVSNLDKFENTSIKKDVKQCCHCSTVKPPILGGFYCQASSPVKYINSSPAKSPVKETISSSERQFGEVMPLVVMEDCRQERIMALKKSQMFQKFVLEGGDK